jgi:hypothetical protein
VGPIDRLGNVRPDKLGTRQGRRIARILEFVCMES